MADDPFAEPHSTTSRRWGPGDYADLAELLVPGRPGLVRRVRRRRGPGGAGRGRRRRQLRRSLAAEEGCARRGLRPRAGDGRAGARARTRPRATTSSGSRPTRRTLPFDDDRFDCVGSVFGAMIAPQPELVAEELFRVVRPGNTVGMTAWTPDSKAVEMFDVGRRYAPGGPPAHTPDRWGDEDNVRALVRRPGQLDRVRAPRRACGPATRRRSSSR